MDSRKQVFRETGIIALGVLPCSCVMLCIYGLLGAFSTAVLLGAIMGAVLAIANFFFMAIFVTVASDKATGQDVKGGQLLVRNSYMLRLIILFVILFACAKSGYFSPLPLVLPLLFVRPTITVAEFFRKKGEAK